MKRVTNDELTTLMDRHEDLVLLNVQEQAEFDQAHIPGSINASAMDKDFVKRVEETVSEKNTPIAVYCGSEMCRLSESGAERLENAGFEEVFRYSGGTKDWADHDLEIEGSLKDKKRSDKQNGNKPSEKAKRSGNEGKAKDKQSSSAESASDAEELQETSDDSGEDTKQQATTNENGEEEGAESGGKGESETTEADAGENQSQPKGEEEGMDPAESSTIERAASVEWNGALKDGRGTMRLGSAGSVELPYTFKSRFESADMTNPEELLGAAHAACFTMALAGLLGKEGYAPKKLESQSRVKLSKENGGYRIASIELEVRGAVDGIDDKTFAEYARKAGKECPVSKALQGTKIIIIA